jgi:hypothetical protein
LISTSPWSAKPLAAVRGPLPCVSAHPAALAVGVEARHVQRAVVQQLALAAAPPGLMLSRLTNL